MIGHIVGDIQVLHNHILTDKEQILQRLVLKWSAMDKYHGFQIVQLYDMNKWKFTFAFFDAIFQTRISEP